MTRLLPLLVPVRMAERKKGMFEPVKPVDLDRFKMHDDAMVK